MRRQKRYLALVSLQLVVSCLHHSIKRLSITAQENSLQFIAMTPICAYPCSTPPICYLTVKFISAANLNHLQPTKQIVSDVPDESDSVRCQCHMSRFSWIEAVTQSDTGAC